MITVTWKTAEGESGEVQLVGDDKWTFGRADGSETPTVSVDHPLISRSALVIRDAGPGPVVFRGQRDNGAKVALISVIGSVTLIDEGTASNLSAEENRVELSMDGEVLVTVDIAFDDRGTVVERQQADDA
ncbi:hypothetical protein [Aeromicrobium sp. UC242_57]|uniref:hypothetical protein n=1 Tax=Aeromicrobium sp. UC242_57 TaxID=3374624 RepID=UPI0037BAC89D